MSNMSCMIWWAIVRMDMGYFIVKKYRCGAIKEKFEFVFGGII